MGFCIYFAATIGGDEPFQSRLENGVISQGWKNGQTGKSGTQFSIDLDNRLPAAAIGYRLLSGLVSLTASIAGIHMRLITASGDQPFEDLRFTIDDLFELDGLSFKQRQQ